MKPTPDWHENCKHQGSKVVKYTKFLQRYKKTLNKQSLRCYLWHQTVFSTAAKQ